MLMINLFDGITTPNRFASDLHDFFAAWTANVDIRPRRRLPLDVWGSPDRLQGGWRWRPVQVL